jgi:hypothetical protein
MGREENGKRGKEREGSTKESAGKKSGQFSTLPSGAFLYTKQNIINQSILGELTCCKNDKNIDLVQCTKICLTRIN